MSSLSSLLLALVPQGSPRIDAGPDHVVEPPNQEVVLEARVRGLRTSEIPNGTTFVWSQLSGPQTTLIGTDTIRPRVVVGEPGRARIRVKARFPDGSVSSDDVFVTVLAQDHSADLAGELRVWHTVTLSWWSEEALSETGTPNPFLDRRLFAWFWHPESRTLLTVPGYFAADGNAAETSATSGNRWNVEFTPERSGVWFYLASFRSGPALAIDPDPEAGNPLEFDGGSGSIVIEPASPLAPGFRSKGRVDYVGRHHLRTTETHEWFLKSGTNSPENFLGYHEIDNTFDQGGSLNNLPGGLHRYTAHLGDFTGGPTWQGGKGAALFGALEYLAASGVNSLYALTYNLDGGDGREVWPWIGNGFDKTRFDVSKLAQWQRIGARMNELGIVWHVVTQEAENDHALDGGALGLARKLYYRELVARFAHLPGLVWNLGEENDGSPAERRSFADAIRALDAYDHPIAIHNRVGDLGGTFGTLLGTHLELVSLQSDGPSAEAIMADLRADSAAAGRPWAICFDELNPADFGVVPDAVDPNHDFVRKEALWPNLVSGGAGCEWYFGYAHPNADLDCEDFRSRANMWSQTRLALDFLRNHVPFQDMRPASELVAGGTASVLALPGEFYVVYAPNGGTVSLDLQGFAHGFRVDWFEPRLGGPLQTGSVTSVSGPGIRSLGTPPGPGDRVALLRRTATRPPDIVELSVEPSVFVSGDLVVRVRVTDPDGPSDAQTVTLEVREPGGALFGSFTLPHRGGDLWSLYLPSRPSFTPGFWSLVARSTDSAGLFDESTAFFEAR